MYDESTKKRAYSLYVEYLKSGIKEHNIITKIGKTMNIPDSTLRNWSHDCDWSLRANVEVIKSGKLDFLGIPKKLVEYMTPENAVEMGRLVFDVIQSVEVKPNGTETAHQQSGDVGMGEAASGADGVPEDLNTHAQIPPSEVARKD